MQTGRISRNGVRKPKELVYGNAGAFWGKIAERHQVATTSGQGANEGKEASIV